MKRFEDRTMLLFIVVKRRLAAQCGVTVPDTEMLIPSLDARYVTCEYILIMMDINLEMDSP